MTTTRAIIIGLLVVLVAIIAYFVVQGTGQVPLGVGTQQPTSIDTSTSTVPMAGDENSSENQNAGGTATPSGDTVTLTISHSGTVNGVTIIPKEVVEDSRCAKDVQCIQAGRVRVRAAAGGADQVFLVGEPLAVGSARVTLIAVSPDKVSTVALKPSDYRFTFKVEKGVSITYKNATADNIKVATPMPGAVTGKTFAIKGQARGNWYSEAVFPVDVLDANGHTIAHAQAHADGEWMTNDFSPFTANVTIPASYQGAATVVLKNDNPSGLPEHERSASYPITIEY